MQVAVWETYGEETADVRVSRLLSSSESESFIVMKFYFGVLDLTIQNKVKNENNKTA